MRRTSGVGLEAWKLEGLVGGHRTLGLAAGVAILSCLTAASVSAQICFGDCDGDRRVTVDEVVMGIQFALGTRRPYPVCYAFDPDFDEQVDVADLTTAVNNLLDGCGLESYDELERRRQENLAKWQAAGIDDYEIDFQRLCFCLPPSDARILVRDSQVVSVVDPETGEEIEDPFATGFTSVDGVFDLIAGAIAQHAVELHVEYHPELGYPIEVSIDYAAPVVDEELTVRITELRPQRTE